MLRVLTRGCLSCCCASRCHPWGLLVWILRTGLRPGRLCWQGLPSPGYPRGGQGSDGPGVRWGPGLGPRSHCSCGLQPPESPQALWPIVSEHLRLLRETDLGRWPESPFQVGLGPKAAVSIPHMGSRAPTGVSEPSLSQRCPRRVFGARGSAFSGTFCGWVVTTQYETPCLSGP